METLKAFIYFIIENDKWITLVVNVLLGISTFVLTIVNLNLVHKQNVIAEEQTKLQKDKDQPHFQISLKSEKDTDDGKYGTDILTVTNIGEHTIEPCEVKADVFIRMTRSKLAQRDTIYALVGDYFMMAYKGNIGDEDVYYSKSTGSNRIYSEIYMEALNDKSQRGDLVYYLIDKVLLLRINYTDIHGEKHEKYYSYSKEIGKEEYTRVFEESDSRGLFFSLNNITYEKLKDALVKIDKGK